MVEVVPFSGLLFNEEKTGPLDQVTAPPYDVISPEEQEALHKKNPYNVVRLILGRMFSEDNENDNRYTRSANTFKQWIHEEILTRDKTSGFYVYSQEYTFAGKSLTRAGFFARVKVEDFSTGNICPHEFTLAKAKKDRMHLLEACRANFSPIFGLFSDPSGDIDGKLEQVMQKKPMGVISDGTVIHRLWRLEEREVTDCISRSFREKKIYIADGHHRYETALAFHKNHGDEVEDSAHVMMFLTNLDSESMSIYAIHRLIRCPSAFDGQDFLSRVGEFFEVEPLPDSSPPEKFKSTLESAGEDATVFCIYLGRGKGYFLKLQNRDSVIPFLQADEPEELKVLDVAQLHALVIRSILNIDTKQSSNQQYLSYTVDIGEAIRRVDAGEFNLAFFMNPTRIAQVRRLAENGIRLPQKATYFYPKLLSGLVINKFGP